MLIKYEFIKIIRRKSTLIVMAISLLVTAFLFGLPVMQFQTYNQDGVIKGMAGIAYEKKQHECQSVLLTEENISSTIREYQRLFEDPDNVGYDGTERFLIGDAYWCFAASRTKLLRMIAGNYSRPGESADLNNLLDLDVGESAFFYQARDEKIETLLGMPSYSLSEQQKQYWRNINDEVDTPLRYGYYEGWEKITSSFELLMFALLAVCIVLAPVFAGEYQTGTDAVILSGMYGKTKLITAKIISSVMFGLLAFSIHVIAALGIPLMAFGVDGWNLPMQIANTTIPYPYTFLQGALLNLSVIYIMLIAMIGITLLLSAKMKTPYLVLMVLVPVLFIPLFLSPNGTTGIYNLAVFLLPYRSTVLEINKYISYQFGGLVLDVFSVRAILYSVLASITIPFTRLGFKKHQVS